MLRTEAWPPPYEPHRLSGSEPNLPISQATDLGIENPTRNRECEIVQHLGSLLRSPHILRSRRSRRLSLFPAWDQPSGKGETVR